MAAPSTSYSSLLRRSKLASFTPQIDQVYTTGSANLARSNFGFKRPLPQATTKTSPFVRLTQIDSPEGRTVFRKATRETKFVKQWGETGVGLQSQTYSAVDGGRKYDRLELQSRFVEGSGPGAVKAVNGSSTGGSTLSRMPNVFALSESEFDHFLEDLGERRDEFKAFVVAELNKANHASQPVHADEFDLYDHAQRNPTELIRLVERFLRLPSSSTSSLTSAPLPQVHPTLALQYASPTPLESALAPPVPGRILGPAPSPNRKVEYYGYSKFDAVASVLSTVSTVPNATNSASSTTFFPDANGVRSNAPGRATFRINNAVVNPHKYITRTAIETSHSLGRKSSEFAPATAEYQPKLFRDQVIEAKPQLVPAESTTPPLPGTPAYSGNLPADLQRRSSPSSAGGRTATSLTELWSDSIPGARAAAKALGGQQAPRDLLAARKNRRTKEQQEKWQRQREGLLESTQAEGARERTRSATGGKKAANQGKKAAATRDTLRRLDELLGKK